jgi:hypothetical protein
VGHPIDDSDDNPDVILNGVSRLGFQTNRLHSALRTPFTGWPE